MSKKSALPSLLTVLLVFMVLPVMVYAQPPPVPPINVPNILDRLATYVMWPILYGFAVIMVVVAGIKYLLARGEPAGVQGANKAILWAVVGIFVGILAYSANIIVNWLVFG